MTPHLVCPTCDGRRWMRLYPNPSDAASSLAAPCLGCSADRALSEILEERGVSLYRDAAGHWQERPSGHATEGEW